MATTFPIDGELSIYQAAELKPQLLQALAASDRLEVDLSGVTELDTAGVQLLFLIKRAAALQDKRVDFVHHSPAVVEVFDLINLAGQFGDPIVLDAA